MVVVCAKAGYVVSVLSEYLNGKKTEAFPL